MKKEKKPQSPKSQLSSTPIMGQPENAFELQNKYGTYEIQPTNDSDNAYPAIAQGLSKKALEEPAEKRDNDE